MIVWLRMGAVGLACAVAAVLAMARPAAAQVDVTPPVVVSLSISPTLVDTTQTSQTVTFTAHITDDLSGMEYAMIWITPLLYGDDQIKSLYYNDNDRVAGEATDGIYVTTLELPRYSADGRWIVEEMYVSDEVGNHASCYSRNEAWCPADWRSYFFVNVRDNLFLYLPQLMGRW